MPYLPELIFLTILYIISYGIGSLIARFWWPVRILCILIFAGWYEQFYDFSVVNFQIVVVLIVPVIIFLLPSFRKFLPSYFRIPNPFSFIHDKIMERKYLRHREKELEFEKARWEHEQTMNRMQAEEAERQRQFQREKAEREARERAKDREERERKEKTNGSRQGRKEDKEESASESSKENYSGQDPYTVLGVTRDMSKGEIKKAYYALLKQYAPDKVSHLAEEFQKRAHEKCIQFNLAWEKISKATNHK